jgi:hypothetical protein
MYSIETKNNIKIPIMRKKNNYDFTDKPLFRLNFEKQPINKPNVFSSIFIQFERIEILLYI